MKKWYSIRMRASSGESHENGGQHISGAERLVKKIDIETTAMELIQRATNHSRGKADFISLKIDSIPRDDIQMVAPLHIKEIKNTDTHSTKNVLREASLPIKQEILFSLYDWIIQDDVTRGAIIVDIHSGKRLDTNLERGVRVSHIDWDEAYKHKWLIENHTHQPKKLIEAMAIASKVASAGTICELCCSDDPKYTTGYISFQNTYYRIPNMKEKGSDCGGRVFIVDATKFNLDTYVHYLEKTPVLIGEKV
ncbi:6-carboxyhexanoate--CoA ligase [Cerasibacillus terrae]|uniref:6-carboxyhexanoate--CoA ligase n=1 Tax=Cerasibacillus terrae TaxID=2498845 RepID=A0A5C8NX80_9BACI|nr:6-carboxyhexanoate--CoA ligase [Cerasibacillus terrae]TXL65699.1 6-carboxyhexanoate--CoA ligase [Cerasibacillus terrae]